MNLAPDTQDPRLLAWWWRPEPHYSWRRYLPSSLSSSATKSATRSPLAKLCPTPSWTLYPSSQAPSCLMESSLFYPVNITLFVPENTMNIWLLFIIFYLILFFYNFKYLLLHPSPKNRNFPFKEISFSLMKWDPFSTNTLFYLSLLLYQFCIKTRVISNVLIFRERIEYYISKTSAKNETFLLRQNGGSTYF